jgi:hypothetical protein
MTFPNVIAGVLIGAVSEPWLAVLAASVGWGFIWSGYRWVFEGRPRIAILREPGRRLFLGSPGLTFLTIEWTLAFAVSLLFASVTYFIPRLF